MGGVNGCQWTAVKCSMCKAIWCIGTDRFGLAIQILVHSFAISIGPVTTKQAWKIFVVTKQKCFARPHPAPIFDDDPPISCPGRDQIGGQR